MGQTASHHGGCGHADSGCAYTLNELAAIGSTAAENALDYFFCH
jgi:hypothetical protein